MLTQSDTNKWLTLVKRASLLSTSGQSSLVLSSHFSKVVGLDVSTTQVEEAKQQLSQQANLIKNVEFRSQCQYYTTTLNYFKTFFSMSPRFYPRGALFDPCYPIRAVRGQRAARLQSCRPRFYCSVSVTVSDLWRPLKLSGRHD